MKDIKALCRSPAWADSCAIDVCHGNGLLEKVYQKPGLTVCTAGFDVKQQHPIKVNGEDGTLLGNYLADLR